MQYLITIVYTQLWYKVKVKTQITYFINLYETK